jgi:hypothetical protein
MFALKNYQIDFVLVFFNDFNVIILKNKKINLIYF